MIQTNLKLEQIDQTTWVLIFRIRVMMVQWCSAWSTQRERFADSRGCGSGKETSRGNSRP